MDYYHRITFYRIFNLGLLTIFTSILADTVTVVNNTMQTIFLPSVTNITIERGALAVLPCSVQNLKDKQVVWRYVDTDKFLTIGRTTWLKTSDIIVEHFAQGDNISNWDLLIKNAEFKSSGVYECQITSTVDLTRQIQLNIIETTITGETAVNRGAKIYIKCNVTGGPHIPNDILWYKDGHIVSSITFPNVIVTKYITKHLNLQSYITEIIVDKSVFSDTGIYTCKSPSTDAVKSKIRLQIGDTVHVKRIPVFKDLRKERRKHSTPMYKSGSFQKGNSSEKLLAYKYITYNVMVLAIMLIWNS